MSKILPRLRPGLDIFPSPSAEHPGIVIRDSMRYSEAILLIPPIWVVALPCLDGQQTDLDLQAMLTRRTGQIAPSEAIASFVDALRSQGFLETEEFYAMRDKRQAEFRAAEVRESTHSENYPRDVLDGYLSGTGLQACVPAPNLLGIAAPHVSPEGGWQSYADAYRRITPDLADRVFVILGTSHYGEPEKFGLTRKPYATPLGTSECDQPMLDQLIKRAPSAVIEEDYCHAVEHSIEFQVLFLQHVMQQPVKVLPILCGTFLDSLTTGRKPESQDSVRAFFDALGELAAEHGKRLFWLLGIDMAHMGARYGDNFAATADQGQMAEVAMRDQSRLERVCAGDCDSFLEMVTPNGDDLKWCGYSPLYTFMRALPGTPGKVLRYEQWNIDPQSVVSFGAIEFPGLRASQSPAGQP